MQCHDYANAVYVDVEIELHVRFVCVCAFVCVLEVPGVDGAAAGECTVRPLSVLALGSELEVAGLGIWLI